MACIVSADHQRGGLALAASAARGNLHQELLLLTECGLSNEEALRAATSSPARKFGLVDRGRIETGRRADLLLVKGDPSKDIRATRDQ